MRLLSFASVVVVLAIAGTASSNNHMNTVTCCANEYVKYFKRLVNFAKDWDSKSSVLGAFKKPMCKQLGSQSPLEKMVLKGDPDSAIEAEVVHNGENSLFNSMGGVLPRPCDNSQFADLGAPLSSKSDHCHSFLFGRSSVKFGLKESSYHDAASTLGLISHEYLNSLQGYCDPHAVLDPGTSRRFWPVDNAFTYYLYGDLVKNAIFRGAGTFVADPSIDTPAKEIDAFLAKCDAQAFYTCFEFYFFACDKEISSKVTLWWLPASKEADETSLPMLAASGKKFSSDNLVKIRDEAAATVKKYCKDDKTKLRSWLNTVYDYHSSSYEYLDQMQAAGHPAFGVTKTHLEALYNTPTGHKPFTTTAWQTPGMLTKFKFRTNRKASTASASVANILSRP